jgi:integrase
LRLSKVKAAAPSSRPARRTYTDDELLALFKGPPEKASGRKRGKDRLVLDLLVLGMATGARIDELCSLRVGDVERDKRAKVAYLQIRHGKTAAARREVPVVNSAALAVIDRRVAGKTGDAFLFDEATPGGPDNKRSWHASKAFGRWRRACGVPDGPDFHSLRRGVATILDRKGVEPVRAFRFFGHDVPTLMHKTYSAGLGRVEMRAVAEVIRYSREVEREMLTGTQPRRNC